MKTLDKAEIFAVGLWNDIKVTKEMLVELANNFTRLLDVVDVPLKLGHNDEQALKADGEMSLGWVSRVWVEGDKLFAKFTDMPDIVHDAVVNKRYKNVSIEALFDVKHKDVDYGTVLTAVALLGADMPAVNTLKDLTTYMTKNNLAFSSHAIFSKKPITKSEESPMTPEEQKRMDDLQTQVTNLTAEKISFKANEAAHKAELKRLEDESKKAAFTAELKTVTERAESLVTSKQITPAQRDDILKDITEETIGKAQFALDLFKDNDKSKGFSTKETGMEDDEDEDNKNLSASDRVDIEATKVQMSAKIPYGEAVKQVLDADPKLAKEFANENDGGES